EPGAGLRRDRVVAYRGGAQTGKRAAAEGRRIVGTRLWGRIYTATPSHVMAGLVAASTSCCWQWQSRSATLLPWRPRSPTWYPRRIGAAGTSQDKPGHDDSGVAMVPSRRLPPRCRD